MSKYTLAILVIVVAFFHAFSATAQTSNSEIDRRLKDLEKQNRALRQELDELKTRLGQPEFEGRKSEDVEFLKEETEEISDRLDVVERKSILDNVQFGGEIRTRVDYYDYGDIVINGEKQDRQTNELWSNRMRLNLRSDITKDLVFHGRLTWFKMWGDTNFNIEASDFDHPSIPDNEGDLHVERAYIDYFIPKTPVSLTFGRLPTSEGPPNGLRDNTTRKATWPKLMNDVETDGIIANLSLDWAGLKHSMFRVGYSKQNQNYQDYQGFEADDARILATAFETEIPKVRDSIFWLGYIRIEDVGSLKSVPDYLPFSVASFPKDAGKWNLYNFHLQFKNIMNLGLDWFASYSHLRIEVPDEGTVLAVTLPDGSVMPINEVGLYSESANGSLGEDRSGNAFFTGLRYKLPIRSMKYPLIGFEFNCGSKYWSGVTSAGGGDVINKLDVNGEVYELYYIQPISEKHMFCRFGAVRMDHDYENPFDLYGDQVESDMRVIQTYFLADVRF